MLTIWAFNNIKFCESLREPLENIIDFEKKKMLPLTKQELKLRKGP